MIDSPKLGNDNADVAQRLARYACRCCCCRLLQQLPTVPLRTTLAANMIAASLEMAILGIFHGDVHPGLSERTSDRTWKLGLHLCVPSRGRRQRTEKSHRTGVMLGSLTPIVPPRHEDVLRRACEPTLGSRTPMVLGLDSFISLRTLFSTWDSKWPYDRVVLDMLRRANSRAFGERCDESVLVHIPLDAELDTACTQPPRMLMAVKSEDTNPGIRSDGSSVSWRYRRHLHLRSPPGTPRSRLFQPIIHASSDPGDLVLDPFVGSGTTCRIAKE